MLQLKQALHEKISVQAAQVDSSAPEALRLSVQKWDNVRGIVSTGHNEGVT
jgi:hypothetical protein